ncbi:hypothetical protein [Sphingomonas sp.]|uniref:hypothetical protein n=1 Tax=Sphingomonas sp. TaxID=28214 RepID=UPI003B3A2C40
MLDFDRSRSAFLYNGVIIGPATRLSDLETQLEGEAGPIPGQPGWSQFKTKGAPINLTLTFYDDIAHSGYLWANVPGGGSWDEAEKTEAARRAEHEKIASRLFGADHFDDARIKVSLVRDPRSYLEQIFFEFLRDA